MAGLPCDACQEETIVVPMGTVDVDVDGHTIYRRYRVCINPTCERYRQRRDTVEMYLPDREGPPTLVDTAQLRQYLPVEPAPDGLPSLFDDS